MICYIVKIAYMSISTNIPHLILFLWKICRQWAIIVSETSNFLELKPFE